MEAENKKKKYNPFVEENIGKAYVYVVNGQKRKKYIRQCEVCNKIWAGSRSMELDLTCSRKCFFNRFRKNSEKYLNEIMPKEEAAVYKSHMNLKDAVLYPKETRTMDAPQKSNFEFTHILINKFEHNISHLQKDIQKDAALCIEDVVGKEILNFWKNLTFAKK